ncbi:MAG: type I glutamate--ammonia ligase [Deltaproteobacteria bacterium]|nr:type I glutamate--ammonia ligase [Deltaproteobacteria bacterium]MBU53645.1 type I glutamate--ammonia ligase [Deltaproteobacteria bacterium]
MGKSNREVTIRDVFRLVKDGDIRFIDLKFVDLLGALLHITLPVEMLDESLIIEGFGFDGSSVRGFAEIHDSDMVMKPDIQTMFIDPFMDDPTISFMCDIISPKEQQIYSRDTRSVAKRAMLYLEKSTMADRAYFGPELEFFIFDDVRYDQTTQHGFYYLDTDSAFWNSGRDEKPNLGYKPRRKGAYFATPPVDSHHNLRAKMINVLKSIGVEAEVHHHEVASGGQMELGMRFNTLLRIADHALLYKYVVKNVSQRYGKTATFMPKPLFEENGTGMHVHVSLWEGGTNLFYKEGTYADLSDEALYFIGGLLHHAPALCAFCNPTTNSYRRLVPGYEAPINLVFSQSNRSACVRIPMSASSHNSKRLEYRPPDPSANPYLAYSAILMAGIDGIRNKIAPPNPVDEDIYELVKHNPNHGIRSTPGSLPEAIEALKADHDFLMKGDVFSKDLIEKWIEYKEKEEIDFVRLRPHPAEFTLYYDV